MKLVLQQVGDSHMFMTFLHPYKPREIERPRLGFAVRAKKPPGKYVTRHPGGAECEVDHHLRGAACEFHGGETAEISNHTGSARKPDRSWAAGGMGDAPLMGNRDPRAWLGVPYERRPYP